MWNTFFGLIAATTDDPNTSARGSFMLLPVLPLIIAFVGMARPDALWMRILSILPPTSPILLTLRLVLTEVSWWEVAWRWHCWPWPAGCFAGPRARSSVWGS